MLTTTTEQQPDELREVKSILVTQPQPTDLDSPYHKLASKYNIKVDFRPFIEVQPLPMKDFRKQKVDILAHTAIIFTSRNAIDHFFEICKQLKIEMPAEMKYFCVSEQTANYLQKYIVIRKRKVFAGQKSAMDLTEFIKKHKDEKYLYPCSEIRKEELPRWMMENKYNLTEVVIYRTVPSNLSDLQLSNYDMIAFFSPSGVSSLLHNFPDFQQKQIRIAAFGPTTAKAIKDHHLRLDIEAPLPNAPSMTGAIELYIRKVNKIE
ncbi:MAG: uroporphyrinogen-III synthase [Flammeovirgaceae bacterium]|nr:uroporphyrinogen-III synthase [Flammeovirgaceae bacterium]MDW8288623.1 uroporphyrinogen-III synthase [Flammeovirgaceae bacterium]